MSMTRAFRNLLAKRASTSKPPVRRRPTTRLFVEALEERWVPSATELLTPEQAIVRAVNNLSATQDGYLLHNPRHSATFTAEGLHFTPRNGGPDWHWELASVGTEAESFVDIAVAGVAPRQESPTLLSYDRGALIEQYVLRGGSIEQQFLIEQRPELDGRDLVIAGLVHSAGTVETTEQGWAWRTDAGAVTLGQVFVYDAAGTRLPATMEVT